MDKSFTKPMLKKLRDKINESFKDGIDLGDHKLQLTLGNCSFDHEKATFKLMVTFEGNSLADIQKKQEAHDLKQMAHLCDIDLERKHPRYTLVGYKMTLSNGEIGDVPLDETNRDYMAIQEWIADGNTVSEPE